jgi:hypothetical protein
VIDASEVVRKGCGERTAHKRETEEIKVKSFNPCNGTILLAVFTTLGPCNEQ